MTERTCQRCKKKFQARGLRAFCSRACSIASKKCLDHASVLEFRNSQGKS